MIYDVLSILSVRNMNTVMNEGLYHHHHRRRLIIIIIIISIVSCGQSVLSSINKMYSYVKKEKHTVIVHYLMFFFYFYVKVRGGKWQRIPLNSTQGGGVYYIINYLVRLLLYNPNRTDLGSAGSFHHLYILKEDGYNQRFLNPINRAMSSPIFHIDPLHPMFVSLAFLQLGTRSLRTLILKYLEKFLYDKNCLR